MQRKPSPLANMLLKSTALLFMSSGTYALVSRQDECTFTLTTGGSVSAPVGQYGGGQTRAGPGDTPSNFLLKGDTIIDAQGRGCWWTPPALVLQCDVGQIPEAGFGIDCDGTLSYSGQTTFHQCATNVDDLVMIYREPNGSNCGEISLKANGCSQSNCSSSAPPDTSITVPSNSSVTATATETPIWPNSTTSIPGNTTAESTGSNTLYPTSSESAPSTSCETTQPVESATTSIADSSTTEPSNPVTESYPSAAPTDSQNSSCSSCNTGDTAGYVTETQSSSVLTTTDCNTGQKTSIATVPANSGWNSTTKTEPGPGQAYPPPSTLETQTSPTELQTGGESSYETTGPESPTTEESGTEQSTTEQSTAEQTITEQTTAEQSTYPGTSNVDSATGVYSTGTVTVTSCGPEVTSCPGDSPSTDVSVTSTVPCNSTATDASSESSTRHNTTTTAAPPYPTGNNATAPHPTAGPPSSHPISTATPPSPPPTCPGELTGDWEFPHLIVPVDSSNPGAPGGTSFFGEATATVSTIFNFDIPRAAAGRTCTAVFLLPARDRLETSSFNLTGPGGAAAVRFARLVAPAPATERTAAAAATAPGAARDYGPLALAPGTAHELDAFACPAGEAVAFEMRSDGGETSFRYFQDYNPCPIGLYITIS